MARGITNPTKQTLTVKIMDMRILELFGHISVQISISSLPNGNCFTLKYIESGIKARKSRIHKSRMLHIATLGVIFLADVLKMQIYLSMLIIVIVQIITDAQTNITYTNILQTKVPKTQVPVNRAAAIKGLPETKRMSATARLQIK